MNFYLIFHDTPNECFFLPSPSIARASHDPEGFDLAPAIMVTIWFLWWRFGFIIDWTKRDGTNT